MFLNRMVKYWLAETVRRKKKVQYLPSDFWDCLQSVEFHKLLPRSKLDAVFGLFATLPTHCLLLVRAVGHYKGNRVERQKLTKAIKQQWPSNHFSLALWLVLLLVGFLALILLILFSVP